MKDDFNRRYLEVMPAPADQKKFYEGLTPDECVECRASIRHGLDRYYQRNDPEDGTPEQIARDFGGNQLAGVLMHVTFDSVCEACGDRLLKHPVN